MIDRVLKNFENAKEVYNELGVDVDGALAEFDRISVSLHCWQGDDVKGLEGLGDVASQNVVTGNYFGAARTGDELRSDIDTAIALSPLKHKVNLHSMYAEKSNPRNDLTVEDFRNWIDWAKERGYGLDFNTSFFTHPMMNNGCSLASPDKATRDYWIKAALDSREISLAIGKELGQRCYNNIWVPDGLKDIPADRFKYRELLMDSLDKIMAKPYSDEERRFACDTLEGKLFGIGTECFTVGSHEFYLAYALTHKCGICFDTGHYHPTETVIDKLSSVTPFIDDILLHVSRGVHWDSDHVVIQSDELYGLMQQMKRGNLYGKVAIGLDYFDASINRVAAWAIGLRATAKAILMSLLEPTALLVKAENEGDFTSRLLWTDEIMNLPFNAVWDYLLESRGLPCGKGALEVIKTYERDVQSKR